MAGSPSERAKRLVERFFPGLEPRPLLLGSFVALILTLYWRHSHHDRAPRGLVSALMKGTGLAVPGFFQQLFTHVVAVVLLFLVPLGVARGMGLRPRDVGLGVRGSRRELAIVLGMWAAFLPILWIASRTPSFLSAYPRLRAMSDDAGLFFLYETVYVAKWIAWEFFFRGFMLFAFEKDFGRKSVIVSTIPFVLMHYTKPEAEMLAAIVAGPLLCAIALKSRSIWPGVVLHWLVAASMDFFACRWWR